jgi:dolichyl-phosphate-mannose--protein O-mannosyl transferase
MTDLDNAQAPLPPSVDSNVTLKSFLSPLGLLLTALVVFGLFLRFYHFGYPSELEFDEHHFVNTARGYLQQQADWNDHPPLGKLLIALGMKFVGDSSIGFRVPALFAGLLTVSVGALAARRLFPSQWAAPIAAALLSADGFLIAYSRAALLDGFLVLSSVVALYLATFEISVLWALATGFVFGFAVSIKFSGLGVLLPFLFAVAISKKAYASKLQTLALFAAFGVFTYVTTYSIGLSMTNKPSGPFDVFADTVRLLKHHAELTDMKHPVTSGWVTWFLPTKPVFLGLTEKYGTVRALTTLGNLATWWSSVAIAFLSFAVLLKLGWKTVLTTEPEDGTLASSDAVTAFVLGHGKAVVTLLLSSLGFLAPWILSHRDSYIYHFLPAYAPLVLLLTGFLSWAQTRWPLRVLVMIACVVLVAALYAPLWAYLPLSREALEFRLFLPSWR